MKTIPRNHAKKIDAAFQKASKATCFALDNGFEGQPISLAAVKEIFQKTTYAKLSVVEKDGKAVYTVHVHSNLWYTFGE
jgi:phosphorylcholine metabolism protein LicD